MISAQQMELARCRMALRDTIRLSCRERMEIRRLSNQVALLESQEVDLRLRLKDAKAQALGQVGMPSADVPECPATQLDGRNSFQSVHVIVGLMPAV